MSVVAVAGGTGSIGRAIVDAIVAQKKYELVILGRKTSKELEESLGARVLVADYTDVNSLTAQLEENKVHTVISALSSISGPDPELALIRAAEKSSVTKRFIPSVYGIKYNPEQSGFPPAATKLAAEAELEKTSLEWTLICNGFFLDYWGMPKVKSYLQPTVIILDIAAGMAGVPGSGDTPVVFTYSFDVGKYVAACLTLSKWEKESYVIGDKLTWNEFVKLAEEVRGTKFNVTHDSLETLSTGKITELPGQQQIYPFFPKEALQGMFAQFGIMMDNGQFDFKPKHSLNEAFPEIKPMTAKRILEEGWKS